MTSPESAPVEHDDVAHIDDPDNPTKVWITCNGETFAETDVTNETDLESWLKEQMKVHRDV